MNKSPHRCPHRGFGGFTLIELLVVVVVLALIAMLVAPSFTRMLSKKRVEGITSELVTDLQFARSEAVQRNVKVRMTFGTGCYVIHTWTIASSVACNQSGSTVTNAERLKGVEVPATAALLTASTAYLEFDPLRGLVDPSGSIDVGSASGEWQLRALVSPVGRVRTCSPNSSVSGYSNVCS